MLQLKKNEMSSLYTDLVEVYEMMYATFIDYQLEYDLYKSFLKKYDKNSILEIGCGTGNLSQRFINDNYDYCGLDFSKEMLKIAKKRNPNASFIHADMRHFSLKKPVESIIMTGRTISYLVKNKDVESTFASIHNNMKKGSIFCFDFIDANEFIPEISNKKAITHEVNHKNITYIRKSKWNPNILNSWCFDWESNFYKKEKNNLLKVGTDHSTVRTFTKDEIELFLILNGFEVIEIIKRASYAFPTYVVVTRKG
ncbi:class I SAM-dependent methyltransferase [Aquimarina litoralis]